MSPTVIEMVAFHMAKVDPAGNDPEYFVPLVISGLKGARAEIAELRGDPRNYGQGFADPLGSTIYQLDLMLAEKPSSE